MLRITSRNHCCDVVAKLRDINSNGLLLLKFCHRLTRIARIVSSVKISANPWLVLHCSLRIIRSHRDSQGAAIMQSRLSVSSHGRRLPSLLQKMNPMTKFSTLTLFFTVAFATSFSSFTFSDQTGARRRVFVADSDKRRLAIVAEDGKLEWEVKVGAIHDAHLLPNGNILYQQGWTKVLEITPTQQTVWEYDAGKANAGKRVEVHAFQRLDNGNTMIAESGPARIIEVGTDGTVKHEIKLKTNKPNAHSDTRLVRKLATGNYLVAHESDGFVREYDSTGKIVWEYEIPLFGKDRKGGHGPEAFGNSVFSASRLANGNTLIGAGNGHSVLEVTPAKEIVWKIEQNDLPGITLAWVTRVERLANGNTLIGNCHAGPSNPQIIEVSPDKKVVWTWTDFEQFGNSTTVVEILASKK